MFKKSTDGGGIFGNTVSLATNNSALVLTVICTTWGVNATFAPAIAVSGNNVYLVWYGIDLNHYYKEH